MQRWEKRVCELRT